MIRRLATALCLLAGPWNGVFVAAAEPAVTQRVEHYDVAGATPSDIRVQINQIRPESTVTGQRHDAITRWSIRWRYTYKDGPQGCSFASVTTTLDMTMIMPRLKPDTAPAAVARSFSDYLEKLTLHEQGHVDIANDIAKRVDAGIRALPPQSSCEALGKAANVLGQDMINQARQLNADYDARTQHGRTQGARFP